MSWEQLQAIVQQRRIDQQQARSDPPQACPIDGQMLESNSRGILNCPLGNYRWSPGQPNR
jgi:hypothetical protein